MVDTDGTTVLDWASGCSDKYWFVWLCRTCFKFREHHVNICATVCATATRTHFTSSCSTRLRAGATLWQARAKLGTCDRPKVTLLEIAKAYKLSPGPSVPLKPLPT